MKSSSIPIFILIFFTNCYYNPIVNQILNPPEPTNDSSGLLALGGLTGSDTTVLVTGQIKNLNSSNLVNPTLTLKSQFSLKNNNVTATVSANVNGKFVLKINPGNYVFDINSAGNSFLGSVTFNITSSNTITSNISENAKIKILNLNVLPQSTNVTFEETETIAPSLSSSTPSNGDINVTKPFNMMLNRYETTFIANFSENMDVSTLIASNISVSPTVDFEVQATDNTLTVILIDPQDGTEYSVTLNENLLDKASNSLNPTSTRFTIGNF